MMPELESTFGFKYEVNNESHIQRKTDITCDDSDATNIELLSNINHENSKSELQPKQEFNDKMKHTFVNIYDQKITIKEELLDVTEHQQETDRAQHRLESTLVFKHYEINKTDVHIKRELLINQYENNELKDVEKVTVKSEILDITEQPDEADLQVMKPIINIKENESDEEGTVDNVSKASDRSGDEDPVEHKDIEVCEAIKQEWKDFSATPLSYWSNGLPFDKELRVVLEDVMLTAGKQHTQGTFGEATNNDVSYLKAQTLKNKEIGTHLTIKKRTLTNSTNHMDTGYIEAAKFTYTGLENLHGCPIKTNKNVCARTSAGKGNNEESSKNVYICDICNKSFQRKNYLYQHIQRHLNLFNCTYCSYAGHTKGNLNRHINIKHTKRTIYNCSSCSYRAYDRSGLSRHVNTKHTKETVYSCSYCSYSTCDRSNLCTHVNTKHTENTVYYCTYCSYRTCLKSTLNSHVNSKHTKNTVYNCSYCSYKSYVRSNINSHVNSKHIKKTVYNCSYCSYKSYVRSYLNRHVNSKHIKKTVYNCPYCDYKSFRKSNLNRHINAVHTKNSCFLFLL